ncbi:hypothetical protein BKA82DRAFT_4179998 [Pisolithus tinctorius]|nr:hypothetical protein BKA82DRAFT_4215466 [Pisolithus tinctorius]KAI6144064.1 hypothetical protein BKA82DRAFT_4179998 [Pisolithus tinctorius]
MIFGLLMVSCYLISFSSTNDVSRHGMIGNKIIVAMYYSLSTPYHSTPSTALFTGRWTERRIKATEDGSFMLFKPAPPP